MKVAKFHYITQENKNLSHLESVENACKNGCDWIQLRIKNKSYNEILNISEKAKSICDQYSAKLIINDYWKIAKEIGADGVHLGLDDSRIDFVRQNVDRNFIIGGTANTLQDVILQNERGANYIGLGALRNTFTKKLTKPILNFSGYEKIILSLKQKNINIPIIAIGGINLDDVKTLKTIGVYGVAVSDFITKSNFDKDLISKIKENLIIQKSS